MSPQRVQLKRTKGWRKPEGAVVVSRLSKWGNPFVIRGTTVWLRGVDDWLVWHDGGMPRQVAVSSYRKWLRGEYPGAVVIKAARRRILDDLPELAGKDLACWCPLDEPCHADVLLELANPS